MPDPGKEKLRQFVEAMGEPKPLPPIPGQQQQAQGTGQWLPQEGGDPYWLQAPNAQGDTGQGIPIDPATGQPAYNPFEGQYYIDQYGRKIPRTPTNSSVRSGG